jgi:FkbM family methyltransferase
MMPRQLLTYLSGLYRRISALPTLSGQIRWFRWLNQYLTFWNVIKYRLAEFQRRPTVNVRINGTDLTIRVGTFDIMVAAESLGPEFEPVKDYLAADFDGVIIDAGAYIGSAALKLSKMFPRATIVCIEAASQNFSLLLENVGRNTRIEAIKAALAVRPGITLELQDRGKGHWGFTTISTPADSADSMVIEKVQTITLADIRRKFPNRDIGLMKLDIEGGEKALFEEAAQELSRIPLIFVELHDPIVAGCTEAFERCSKDRNVVNFGGEKYLSYLNGESVKRPNE